VGISAPEGTPGGPYRSLTTLDPRHALESYLNWKQAAGYCVAGIGNARRVGGLLDLEDYTRWKTVPLSNCVAVCA